MTINVHTYGNFSPSFKVLTVKTLEDISKNMNGFPPQCNLYLCKSEEDGLELFKERAKKFLKIIGKTHGHRDEPIDYQTNYLFEFPDIIIVEDLANPNMKRPDIIEGKVSHEGGHAADCWIKQRLTYEPFITPLTFCIINTKCEFDAENNAIDAGYSRQLLARVIEGFNELKKVGTNSSYSSFFNHLRLTSIYAAFMHNKKPDENQKQTFRGVWNSFVESRNKKVVRDLLQSRELREAPEKFGDEDFLEDFIFEKHYGWNFSFV